MDVGAEVDLFAEVLCGGDGAAVFLRLLGAVDLDEDIDIEVFLEREGLEFFDEAERVDRVDESCDGGDLGDFVALEVSDHVPADSFGDVECGLGSETRDREVGESCGASGGDLAHGSVAGEHFIDDGGALVDLEGSAFAEVGVAEFDEFADVIDVGVFADGNDEDVSRRASGMFGGAGDAFHDLAVSTLQRAHDGHPCSSFACRIVPTRWIMNRIAALGRAWKAVWFVAGGALGGVRAGNGYDPNPITRTGISGPIDGATR